MIKVCIINRNFPPYRGATGYHANQLAQYLINSGGYNVSVVTLGAESFEDQLISIHAIKPNYNGRNKLLRLIGTASEGYRLIKKAISLKADFYIVMTDPPVLNYWASRLLTDHHWALWTMDLYPHGFVAGGLAQHNDFKTRHYINSLKANTPNFIIGLGTNQRAYISDIYPETINTVVLPIGLRNEPEESLKTSKIPKWSSPDKITIAYVGNLSEAHDPKLLPYIAANIDATKMHLLVSCYGAHAQQIKEELADIDHVTILSDVPEEDMSYIDVHLVSLTPEWTHICVPSKAISSLHHGAPVLFVGSPESDTSAIAIKAGWSVNNLNQLKEWLHTIDSESIKTKALSIDTTVKELKSQLHNGWEQIKEQINAELS